MPGITKVLNEFHDRIAELQQRFLHVIAVAIGCHETFFDQMLHHGPHLTRAIHYPAMDLAPDEGHVWAGAHGDINLITALPRASAPGLQVQTDDGWIDAVAPEGQVIINTGMMLEQLSNGVIPPGIHRVVSAPGQSGDRYSVVQFCHPTPWTILSPVASCASPRATAALRRHPGRRPAGRGPLGDQPRRGRPPGALKPAGALRRAGRRDSEGDVSDELSERASRAECDDGTEQRVCGGADEKLRRIGRHFLHEDSGHRRPERPREPRERRRDTAGVRQVQHDTAHVGLVQDRSVRRL